MIYSHVITCLAHTRTRSHTSTHTHAHTGTHRHTQAHTGTHRHTRHTHIHTRAPTHARTHNHIKHARTWNFESSTSVGMQCNTCILVYHVLPYHRLYKRYRFSGILHKHPFPITTPILRLQNLFIRRRTSSVDGYLHRSVQHDRRKGMDTLEGIIAGSYISTHCFTYNNVVLS